MLRAGLRKAGQSFNAAGIGYTLRVLTGEQYLALPHLEAPDIRSIHWEALAAAGFTGVVFDKDNTLTLPYATSVHAPLANALERCRAVFGPHRLVLMSNSAGLRQFDPDGREAERVEAALGVPVLRHGAKKPAGGPEALRDYFGGSPPEQLILVGDRYLTDVLFGNRHGLLTVRTAPLSSAGEPLAVRASRALEDRMVDYWRRAGLAATPHARLGDLGGDLRPPAFIAPPGT